MKPALKWTMIIGGGMALGGPALGVLGTVLGMMSSFNTLGKSGVADPKVLSSNIGSALISTAGGIMVGFIGLIIFLAALTIWFVIKPNKPSAPSNS